MCWLTAVFNFFSRILQVHDTTDKKFWMKDGGHCRSKGQVSNQMKYSVGWWADWAVARRIKKFNEPLWFHLMYQTGPWDTVFKTELDPAIS